MEHVWRSVCKQFDSISICVQYKEAPGAAGHPDANPDWLFRSGDCCPSHHLQQESVPWVRTSRGQYRFNTAVYESDFLRNSKSVRGCIFSSLCAGDNRGLRHYVFVLYNRPMNGYSFSWIQYLGSALREFLLPNLVQTSTWTHMLIMKRIHRNI